MSRSMTLLSLALASLLLVACPGGASKKAPQPCQKLGEQCELEPGKLGACHYKADCAGPGCLYCQSQH